MVARPVGAGRPQVEVQVQGESIRGVGAGHALQLPRCEDPGLAHPEAFGRPVGG